MLLLSYFLYDSSFISTQFLALNLGGWFVVLSSKFIVFWYSIIKLYYFNLRSSIILWLSSGDIYFYLSISFSFVSKLFFWWRIWLLQFYQQFYFQLNHRLLLLFWIAPFEAVFSASVADHLASFWLYLLLEYLLIFLPIFLPMFLAKEKDR